MEQLSEPGIMSATRSTNFSFFSNPYPGVVGRRPLGGVVTSGRYEFVFAFTTSPCMSSAEAGRSTLTLRIPLEPPAPRSYIDPSGVAGSEQWESSSSAEPKRILDAGTTPGECARTSSGAILGASVPWREGLAGDLTRDITRTFL
jgi:hypothetical protein